MIFGTHKKNARLGAFNSRKRSNWARWLMPGTWRSPVLTRLAGVAATVVIVTALVHAAGPPLPYRVGEILPHDLRVRVGFELVNYSQTERMREELEQRRLLGETVPDPPLSAFAPVVEKYPAGTPLLRPGHPINERQLVLLHEENRAYARSLTTADHARRFLSLLTIVGLLTVLVALYVHRYQPALATSTPRVLQVCLLTIATIGLGIALARPPWSATLIPMTMAAMTLTIVFNPPFALLMAFSLSIVMTLALVPGLNFLLIQMGGTATAVLLLCKVRTRRRMVQTAILAGLAYVAMTVATGLLTGQTVKFIAADASRHFLWAVLAGFVLSGCLPLLERCFGIVTDVTLLELADSSHPLLQELIRRAPGTYTHSMTVATLAEAAADAIGADSLLTRVGCYFHDVGKMLKPQYFIENQNGYNRHDHLEPALSTLVIIGHVKDGVALAEQYRLPRPVIDFIQQHHGTTLVEYFYREAMRLQEQNGHGSVELEFAFRYPGPRPRSREIGILMLADAIESASRALTAPTPASLSKLVHDILMKRLLDEQFEESGLTLTELHRIEESLTKSLIALYHNRIKYPESDRPTPA